MTRVLLPVLVPLATALVCALASGSARVQRALSLGGALLLLAAAIALLLHVDQHGVARVAVGNWPLPFGIEFAADRLGAALVLVAALMLTLVLLFQAADADAAPHSPALHPLLHGLVAGVGGVFLTADLFNLYVWFEVALICALGLLAHGGTLRQLDAAFKYFILNVFGTMLLLAAIGLLYGVTGQLNFGALAQAAAGSERAVLLPLLGLLAMAFLIKAAAFPFFAWLPASYHTLPAPVLALFSALLAKAGIYALLRLFGGVFHPAPPLLFEALGWIAVASMVTGVLGAAYHWDMRRILAFHSISQIGYILLGIALATPGGYAAAIFFTLHHSIVKPALFLTAALAFRLAGHYDLRRIGGLYAARPGLALLFLLLALSLVGIPPLTGFWAKYLLVREGLAQGAYLWTAVALLVSAITLYSMVKIWLEAFWKPHPEAGRAPAAAVHLAPAWLAVGGLAALMLAASLFPDALLRYTAAAVADLGGGRP